MAIFSGMPSPWLVAWADSRSSQIFIGPGCMPTHSDHCLQTKWASNSKLVTDPSFDEITWTSKNRSFQTYELISIFSSQQAVEPLGSLRGVLHPHPFRFPTTYSHMSLHFLFVKPEAEDDTSWRRVEGLEALLLWNVWDAWSVSISSYIDSLLANSGYAANMFI